MISSILYVLFVSVMITLFFYFLSRVQMKAWLHELDLHLGKKFTEFITNKKEKKDGTEEEK